MGPGACIEPGPGLAWFPRGCLVAGCAADWGGSVVVGASDPAGRRTRWRVCDSEVRS